MRLANPQDDFFQLRADISVSAEDRLWIQSINDKMAARAGVSVDELPVMPIAPFETYPVSLSSQHNGFTLGCTSVILLVKAVAREKGLSKNYVPPAFRTHQVPVPCLN